MKKSAVHFGSGSIGRGFIGKLLHDSGYQVTMLDVDDSIISSINAIGGYDLYLINHNYQKVFIDQVSAINSLKDTQGAIDAIKDADIITTAVLATNLEKIAPILSKGLKARLQLRKAKINILACENLENNSGVLRKKVLALGEIKENDLESIAAFPDTEVDRLVLKSERNGEPAIDIGDEFELVVDKTKLVNPGV
ncbi:Mannitol-1-phosphate 5-dehydrogenase [Lacticaseibacillus paracasei]|nr:Mannitol-1-phosphate 5-dehydrogenase [Lacticaseibacillus paracasei]